LIRIRRRLRLSFFSFNKRWKKLYKNLCWKENWSEAVPKCSNNAPVNSGIPSVHLVVSALAKGKNLPLNCFNSRFYKQSRIHSDHPINSSSEPRDGDVNVEDNSVVFNKN